MSRKRLVSATPHQDLVDHMNGRTKPASPPVQRPTPIGFKNKRQQEYHNSILTHQVTLATGPAGTAKTFVAVYCALVELAMGNVEKIIITKPSVEIGKTQGYLPGDMEEKMAPFTRSVLDCFEKIIGVQQTATLYRDKKKIEIIPLQMMRGLTLDKCFIIADEMQNSEYGQTKALLSRLGEDSKLVLNGDLEQCDLSKESGMPAAIEILKGIQDDGEGEVAFVEFTIDDIVRSGIVKKIIIGYHKLEKNQKSN